MGKQFEKIYDETIKEYAEARPKSKALFNEACKYMPGGDTRTATFFHPYPHFIDRGDGAYMWDVDGNKLLDMQNNYTSLIHGHNHKPTVDAVKAQMEIGSAYASPFEKQYELAKIIVDRFPAIDMVRFCNSGTEATMNLIRAARAFTCRDKVIKTEGGYHGSTDIFEASVDPDLNIAGPLDKINVIPDSKGVPENVLKDVLVAPFNDIERTRKLLADNKDDVACIIIEPIMQTSAATRKKNIGNTLAMLSTMLESLSNETYPALALRVRAYDLPCLIFSILFSALSRACLPLSSLALATANCLSAFALDAARVTLLCARVDWDAFNFF